MITFLVILFKVIMNEKEKEKNKKKINNNEDEEIKPKKEDIYKQEIFDSLYVSFNKAKNFLNKNMKGILIQDKNKFILTNYPIISAVIPVYNSNIIITRAIRSIQNQSILNLEIILINDCSTDNTLFVIENLKKEDKRIRIINNKKNFGSLYSRSIGTLSANGKYIFPLDNDDMFLDKDIFQIITNIADKGNFDIVEFKGILSLLGGSNILKNRIRETSFSKHKLNLVLFQPKLSKFPIKAGKEIGTYKCYDAYLWGKCIKTKVYKSSLNKLGKEKYNRFMLAHEDIIMIYVLFNMAKSFKYVGKFGIFHIQRVGSAFHKTKKIDKNLREFYLADVVIEFSKDAIEDKKLITYLIIRLFNIKILKKLLNLNENNKKLFYSCLDRVLKSKKISNKQKKEIRKRGKSLKYLNYIF